MMLITSLPQVPWRIGLVCCEKIHGLDAELIDVFWGSPANRGL